MTQYRSAARRRLATLVTSPWPYVVWAAVVVVVVVTTYLGDPYVFAFATLGLSGASAAIGLVGACVAFFSPIAGRAKASILIGMAITTAALAAAFLVLATFKWA